LILVSTEILITRYFSSKYHECWPLPSSFNPGT